MTPALCEFGARQQVKRRGAESRRRGNHGRVLRVCGGQREPEDQRGDREAAAEGQEGFPQGAEAAALR